MGIYIILLWIPYLIVRFAPSAFSAARDLLRSRDPSVYACVLLVVAAAFYAFPSSADKGEPPPPPPTPKAGVIRLYYHAADGRLVPFDAPVREVQP